MNLDYNYKIKTLIVNNSTLFVEGMVSLLSTYERIRIVGIACTGSKCLELLNGLTPDVILLQINLQDVGVIELIEDILVISPNTKIIVQVDYSHEELITPALHKGASGFLLEDCSTCDLLNAIDKVHHQGIYISENFVLSINKRQNYMNEPNSVTSYWKTLTKRELGVLKLISEGLQNKEISNWLGIKIRTVDTHVSSILAKLSVSNRVEATIVYKKIIDTVDIKEIYSK